MHKKYKLGIYLTLTNVCILFIFFKGVGWFYSKGDSIRAHNSHIVKLVYLQREINFLYNLNMRCRNETSSGLCDGRVAERILNLRHRQNMELTLSVDDEVIDVESLSTFYKPKDSLDSYEVKWKEGGGAVIYCFNRSFPAEKLLAELSEFYQNAGWKPLKYDLCLPLDKGSIASGWKNGSGKHRFWNQYWVNSKGDVVNVNIVYFDHAKKEAYARVFYCKSENAREAMQYYRKLHGDDDTEPSEETLKKIKEERYKVFTLRPWRKTD